MVSQLHGLGRDKKVPSWIRKSYDSSSASRRVFRGPVREGTQGTGRVNSQLRELMEFPPVLLVHPEDLRDLLHPDRAPCRNLPVFVF